MPMPQPKLETPRLILRPFTESDFHLVHPHASDPEISRYMDWGPNDEAATREFLVASEAGASSDAPTPWASR